MSETSLQKFANYWNIMKASKYFFMISKSLLDCQRVRNIFTEVWQVLECLGIFKIFFLWFLKASWIARGSEISLLKFANYWNVLESSKYFSMIFKSLLDCQRVRNIFTEVWQVLECLGIFKIFFYDF